MSRVRSAVASPALVQCTSSHSSNSQENNNLGDVNSRSRTRYLNAHDNRIRACSSSISPHVLTIPLALASLNQIGRIDRDIGSTLSTTLSVSNTRIQILLSRDGAIGVSFIHHTTGEDASSSIVLFNQPSGIRLGFGYQQQQKQLLRVCKYSRIRIVGGGSLTLRNLLWPTKILPIPNRNHYDDESLPSTLPTSRKNDHFNYFLCRSFRLTNCGHVLFNNEDDTATSNNDHDFTQASHYQSDDDNAFVESLKKEFRFKTKPQRDDIVKPCITDSFEEMYVDPRNGYLVVPPLSSPSSSQHKPTISPFHNTCVSGVRVIFEAYLHVDALLSDIIHRRKKIMFGDDGDGDGQNRKNSSHHVNLPDFYYNIVSFNSSSGRSMTLVVVFANPQRQQESDNYQRNSTVRTKMKNDMKINTSIKSPAAYALFVDMDLFDQSYSEQGWVQHPSKSSSAFLRQWNNQLAVHKRMTETHMGPVCVG